LTFTPTGNYNGPATIQVHVDDLGNTGSGGEQTASSTLNITVNAINDAPVITAQDHAITLDEDTPLTFSAANANLITLSDIDAGAGNVELTLSVDHGTLSLSQTVGLTFNAGANGTASMTLTGSLVALNAAIDGLL